MYSYGRYSTYLVIDITVTFDYLFEYIHEADVSTAYAFTYDYLLS